MASNDSLFMPVHIPVRASDAGLFVSPGAGRHPARAMDSFEFLFVRSGRLRIREMDCEFTVEKNETLLLWPDRQHAGLEEFPPDLSFVWIHFYLISSDASNRAQAAPQAATQNYQLEIPQHGRPPRPDQVRELTHRILGEYGNRGHDQWIGRSALEANGPHFLMADIMLLRILAEITPAASPTRNPPDEPMPVARAIQYVDAHFHEPISAAVVCDALEYSSDYLGSLFHRSQGKTLSEFMQERRVAEARFLLRESVLSIKQVARQCGFTDVGYFSRVFQKVQGSTPSGYRRLHARTFANARSIRPVSDDGGR